MRDPMYIDFNHGTISEAYTGRAWNRAQVAACVARRVRRLESAGLRRGDRVFVLYGNNLEFFADLLAVWSLGACLVPVDGRLTPSEITNLATAAGPRVALVDAWLAAEVEACLRAQSVAIIAGDECDADGNEQVPSRLASAVRLDDDALILFTSGSTGTPKGVVHTHRSLRARWAALRDCLGTRAYARTLCMLPTHFGHGLICNCLFPWLAGQHLVIAPSYSQRALMQLGSLLDEHRITFMSSVPSMWGLVLKASKPPEAGTLERVHCGSAPLSGHLWRDIQAWTRVPHVINTYGITETASWVAGTTGGPAPDDGLVGTPWGAVIRVQRSAEADGLFDPALTCEAGEPGHLWVESAALMRGYFGQPELTAKAVAGGWFNTGDIGLIDATGRLYLRGRERDEINRGGAKIYPSDIDLLVESYKGVREACAFGYSDSLYGQDIGIAVVLELPPGDMIRELHAWLRVHLAHFKMPRRWYVLDALPRTSRGKINRSDVAALCERQTPFNLQAVLAAAPRTEGGLT